MATRLTRRDFFQVTGGPSCLPGHGRSRCRERGRRPVHIGTFDLNAAVAEVKTTYAGPLTVGADLQCTPAQ